MSHWRRAATPLSDQRQSRTHGGTTVQCAIGLHDKGSEQKEHARLFLRAGRVPYLPLTYSSLTASGDSDDRAIRVPNSRRDMVGHNGHRQDMSRARRPPRIAFSVRGDALKCLIDGPDKHFAFPRHQCLGRAAGVTKSQAPAQCPHRRACRRRTREELPRAWRPIRPRRAATPRWRRPATAKPKTALISAPTHVIGASIGRRVALATPPVTP